MNSKEEPLELRAWANISSPKPDSEVLASGDQTASWASIPQTSHTESSLPETAETAAYATFGHTPLLPDRDIGIQDPKPSRRPALYEHGTPRSITKTNQSFLSWICGTGTLFILWATDLFCVCLYRFLTTSPFDAKTEQFVKNKIQYNY